MIAVGSFVRYTDSDGVERKGRVMRAHDDGLLHVKVPGASLLAVVTENEATIIPRRPTDAHKEAQQ